MTTSGILNAPAGTGAGRLHVGGAPCGAGHPVERVVDVLTPASGTRRVG